LDSTLRNQEMGNLASMYGQNFGQAMGFAKEGAAWDRTQALDELSAQQKAADAGRNMLAQYFGLQGQQAGQQLSKYGTDLSGGLAYGNQGLTATTAGMTNAMQQRGLEQQSWDKDVGWDRSLMSRFPGLSGEGGGGGSPKGEIGPQPQAKDPNVARNMNPQLGAQENQRGQAALRKKQEEDELAEYMRQFTTPSGKLAAQSKGLMNFNFNPYDYMMAARSGYKLPDQGKINYQMQSQTRNG